MEKYWYRGYGLVFGKYIPIKEACISPFAQKDKWTNVVKMVGHNKMDR